MLKILLVRHAQCDMNLTVTEKIGGRTNHSPLTALGDQQARALGVHLRAALAHQGVPPSSCQFYSSTAVRAVDTAKHVMAALEVDAARLEQSDELLELDQGEWEGAVRARCYTPDLTAAFAADPWGLAWTFAAPGGESQKQVEERMACYVRQTVLPRLAPGGAPAVVVSHGMAIKCLLRCLLNSDPTMSRNISLANTAITELHFRPGTGGGAEAAAAPLPPAAASGRPSSSTEAAWGGHWQIVRVNDTAHLPLSLASDAAP